MLSSMLRSHRAALGNVEIIRPFVTLRRESGRHAELARKLAGLERNQHLHGESPSPPRTGRDFAEERLRALNP